MKKEIIKFIVVLLICIFLIIVITNFVFKEKDDNIYKNNFYSENINKLSEKDFSIENIKLNMTMEEIKNILGEPKENSEFVDTENPQSSYKRFDYENLIIQFDYDKEIVNYIASSRSDYKNNRGISVGSTITDILKKYYADKNIEIYENNYGTYEILYGKDDALKYLSDLSTENRTFAYIYKYNDEVNSIIFAEKGNVIEFYLTDNKINMIIIAEKYIPW